MNFKDWLALHGLSLNAFARLTGFSVGAIHNLTLGTPPLRKTVIKLARITKSFKPPITYDMFPQVYCRGSHTLISSEEAFEGKSP